MNLVSRLIQTFTPEHYTLSIKLNRIERTFDGTVTVNGASQDDSGEIRLHAKDLSINSVTVDGKEASSRNDINDELVITHPDISQGEHIVVVGFSGKITDEMNGIYPCYFEVNGEKKELLATQFESHYARKAFPCIDEPEAKATFDVILTTETGITVLGNMPIEKQDTQDGSLVTTFETTPRMSTYLVAWVAGEMQKKTTKTKSGVEVSVWSTKAHELSNLDFALDMSARVIDFFEDYFGVPYPLPKSDQVALPDFTSGAMENWGLITYREIALLVDPKHTTISTMHYVALVIAHELSHQWFGNLVTMKWWNDLWLNESFANMMEYVAIDALEPTWDIWLDQATSEVISSLRRDSLDGVQSVQIDVTHPDQISTIFDPSIVYAKGGRLLRMLQAYIGDDALRTGLKAYFEEHQYGNTEAGDLWSALSDSSGKDIAALMNAWITQPGYPVVSASISDNKVKLSQKQFFIGPHSERDRLWPVPLHGSSKQIPGLLNDKAVEFEFDGTEALRLNLGSTAHFVANYSPELFNKVLDELGTLPSVDRLGILNEQILLAQSGVQSTAILIPLLSGFKNETNESVWGVIAMAINELKRFVETNNAAEDKLRKFVGELVSTQYQRLGWTQKTDEDENDTKLRCVIISLAIYGQVKDAVDEAEERYRSTDIVDLDSELRTAIMAHAVRHELTDNIIDTLLSAYTKASNSELRDDIAAALTSTKSIETIKRLAELMKDTKFIRMQDFMHWFVWLIRNRYGRTYMWQWAQENWSWIKSTFEGDSNFDIIPRYIASALTTKQQYEEYRAFFGPLESEVTLARNITIGYTELEGRLELLERDETPVQKALLNLE